MTHDSLISPPASSVSPAGSLTKSDSFLSRHNDYPVDMPSNDRHLKEDSNIESFSLQQHWQCQGNRGIESEVAETENIQREGNETESYCSSGNDLELWFPPEPEDQEDDIEGSVANYEDDDDEDDECGDGMKWEKPSNLSSFAQEGSESFRLREQTRKAMDEVMSGKFKALVEHLLKSAGISCSGNDGETWVDKVTALSWEAASFLKPDAFDGKAMDPYGCVKVKCIATGSRSESEVFKGLIFKKHAAHKHMPTKCKKPKLLLIKGALSVSSDGLSSFELMKQETDRRDYLMGMIQKCNPNVVLVEKTVSRDIQEAILAKGMTLVLEMKQHRLERVAGCIGSPLLSSDNLNDQKLRQCESFYFEKIVEEHAAVCESGKRPTKTLMFLEGCPKRMGFTILLKGSHIDELKTIKCVVQFAVVIAYHLIIENLFLLNQRAMFSSTSPNEMTILPPKESTAEADLISSVDIHISNGFQEKGLKGYNNLSSYEPYESNVLSGLSSLAPSLQKAVGFPLIDHTETSGQDLSSPEDVDTSGMEEKVSCEDHMQSKDDISTVLDSESILVLMTTQNVTRGTACKQSRFSCIKFYRNFDIPLGKFLQDNLLNQKLMCETCNELPEAHLYYYAHHNKQLTVQVKHLPLNKHLPGESEGKLWMWSCCGKCKPSNRSFNSTKRVLVSISARNLSFGKFLELGFSNHSSYEILSSCGHSFYGDYFHFFGLGSMVARFRYSPVATYSVSLPLWKVEFSDSNVDFLKEEVEDVFREGLSMFAEVENSLKKMENKFVGSMLNLQGSCKRFSDVEEMLKQERDRIKVDMKNPTTGTSDVSMNKWWYKPLYLNHIQWELLLHSYIWDQRLHSLLSSDLRVFDTQTVDESGKKQSFKENGVSHNISDLKTDKTEEINTFPCKEIPIKDDYESSNKNVFARSNSSNQFETRQENDLSSSVSLKVADPKGWMWEPFSQIQTIYLNDLHRGFLPKYELMNGYNPGASIHKMIIEEGSRLHFPLGTGNYIVSDYENELSSMIACALAFLKDGNISSEDLNDNNNNKSYESSLISSHWSSFGSIDSDGISSEESRFSSFDGLELMDSSNLHPLISFGRLANKARYSVACLFAKDFLDLRSQCGVSELDFISSLSHCKNWDAKGGKSKSFFAKTLDDRFIIKEIQKTEFCSFLEFASDYFGHMNQCFKLGNQTCLAKILGIYQIRKRKSGAKHDVMVMENVTYCRNITRQYDLKGALHARFNSAVDGAGDVLLDQNFVNDMNASPLYINRKAKWNLQRAVWNDTAFLNSINVMDYSLLVGVDSQKRELVCGIIDYVRQYTLDKQLENWVKSFVVPKNQLPTIISPKEYKKRFRKFIDTHFLSVPDDWCSQRSSNRCNLCGMGSYAKSQELNDDHDDHTIFGEKGKLLVY